MALSVPQSKPELWSPAVYGERFVEERTRPGLELIARVREAVTLTGKTVRTVYDLGCGTGRFIPPLLEALGDVQSVVGVDNSGPMLEKADVWVREELERRKQGLWASKLTFSLGDIANFIALCSDPPADLLFTNSALQWLPDHLSLLTHLLRQLSPSGVLAVQVPNDFQESSHTLMNDIAVEYERRQQLPAGTAARLQRTAAQTAVPSLLSHQQHLRQSGLCSRLDCWETTYLHVISCPVTERHPIAFFLMGSSLNQFMSQLPPPLQPDFLTQYVTALSTHYPLWTETTAAGQEELFCVFPFNRWFIVATRK